MGKMTHGDFREMVGASLFKALESVVNEHAHLTHPYYILVRTDNQYRGQATMNAIREEKTQDMNFDGKKVIHTRLTTFFCPMEIYADPSLCRRSCKAILGQSSDGYIICPLTVRQLGSILFKMDNKKGSMDLVYALPKDRPHDTEDSDNTGPVSKAVARSAQQAGIPLMWM